MAPTKVRDIGELDTSKLLCRATNRHSWLPELTVLDTVKRRKAHVTTWVCERCQARKQSIHDTRGRPVVSGPPEYGDDYLLSKEAIGELDRAGVKAQVMVELLSRMLANGGKLPNTGRRKRG